MDSFLLEMDILEVQNMLFRNMCRQGQHRQRERYIGLIRTGQKKQ